MKIVIEGNHALSYGAKAANVDVVSAYPITPQTQVVEKLSEMCASGELDAKFIKVESEHSAMAAVVGASAAGARAFTATSSQGLLLMHEILHWAVGARLPIVLGNINRAVGPPWSIWTDQNDSLSQRDTGLLQYYCESNQEVFDTVLLAFKVSETVMLPTMIVLDAFFLSHTSEIVEVFGPEEGAKFLPPFKPVDYLTPDNPMAFGNLTSPDSYYELRYKINKDTLRALDVAKEADEEFEKIYGRSYGIIEEYRTEGADTILVTSGTVTSTARAVVDAWRDKGRKLGLLKMRLFRPFPIEDVRRVLGNRKKVVVIDRNIGFSIGGIWAQEVKAALWNMRKQIPIFGFIAGIGGRDITPDVINEILDIADRLEYPEEEVYWIGVKDGQISYSRR
ncbi:MAG: pyruvate ferredoxin oxidoreductase [Candidatus Latescibacteria bacterium]|nr:pyruvate ferredoxin oxidoreductase [Candidatus Latescibacterota bacterium]NIM21150.1 pyruvate ferredoxin oxidoreductase [Candidatus Latescibacterota bacterium]NIM65285.1 pyruvate ferredoxin oxidoreductase [Candidatus Latescibacterota bacterium]NIO01800.1 pyruvate ferredoxin oxidoreductase [Candidatus Latescibacterota bacterium]NIO28317.1 pyruvate ferredoxin oxidoreductase [Candidatus Latescibacterota bacterium]